MSIKYQETRTPNTLTKLALSALIAIIVIASLAFSKRDQIKAGAEIYVFGYPLLIMDLTKEAFTKSMVPENEFFHVDRFPPTDFREVVRPNRDTLYSSAWLNLEYDAMVLSLPMQTERYYLLPIMDAWTNVHVTLGTRQNTPDWSHYLLAGPDWEGTVPDGMELIRFPTNMNWILGRIQTNGVEDYPVVHRQQQATHLISLAEWRSGKRETLPVKIDRNKRSQPPMHQMEEMGAEDFITRLNALMQKNPPYERDKVTLARLQNLVGLPNDWNILDRAAVSLGIFLAKYKLNDAYSQLFESIGWRTPPDEIGNYGVDYPMRAFIAMIGLGANRPEDAMYPTTRTDSEGQKLLGSNKYILHFNADELPPVNAFWSITLYDEEGYFIPNELSRHTRGDRDKLIYNEDGSLDILIQKKPPVAKLVNNWLPTGEAEFISLTARLYWPKASALSGDWTLPAVEKVIIAPTNLESAASK